MSNYTFIEAPAPIKAWINGVPIEDEAIAQIKNAASLPFVKGIALMPDVHVGLGCTIGSVVVTDGAVCPMMVGVDIGCGMMAARFPVRRDDCDWTVNLKEMREAIEHAVPNGRTDNGGKNDRGAWGDVPNDIKENWRGQLLDEFESMCVKYPKLADCNQMRHLGTLGTGNHFIELSFDLEEGYLWVMLHSGSRGVGNHGAELFIRLAKQRCAEWFVNLPDPYLAYFPKSAPEFADYIRFATWAQKFAWLNREIMLERVILALQQFDHRFGDIMESVHCHHNYVALEHHYGKNVYVTRKGAVRARLGEAGIIPGSMGAKSYIVVGKGNKESFDSCSHGAGRAMGRREAMRRFTVEDHVRATEGIECKKDESVLDETPAAYKDIDAVMAAQTDLVEVKYTLKQLVCVKG